MKISVAVPAHNEEANIGLLIDSLRGQRLRRSELVEIVVVASGCADRTIDIVRARQRRGGVPVRLIEEPIRRGKVAAINTYLRHSDRKVGAICVCSGDLLVAPDALERLAAPLLSHPDIGMCGARPVPTNGHGTFLGEATRFLWNMHHRVALEAPKLGELVMVRAGIVHGLPPESAVDEASLEQLISAAGYNLAYVPEAVVHNHGPETLADFIRQRRRIAAGHYWLYDVSGYRVSTMNLRRLVRLTVSEISGLSPQAALYAVGAIGLEGLCRGLGFIDFKTDLDQHVVWKVSETTKAVMTDEVRALYRDLGSDGDEVEDSDVIALHGKSRRVAGT
jgi:cellulose synthase/poly-beta-1,6-N-acetylglucosamine synthase-like glycosyltransferase